MVSLYKPTEKTMPGRGGNVPQPKKKNTLLSGPLLGDNFP